MMLSIVVYFDCLTIKFKRATKVSFNSVISCITFCLCAL